MALSRTSRRAADSTLNGGWLKRFPTARLSYYRAVMRRPDRAELEFTMLLFCVLAPLAYFTVRGLFALAG